MPTSTGTADRGRLRRGNARGFTLVELMVVLTILALAATAVVLTIPGEERSVRSEADRLAARLAAARDVAVVEGRSVAVNFAPSGYGFERRIDGAWAPLPGRARRYPLRRWRRAGRGAHPVRPRRYQPDAAGGGAGGRRGARSGPRFGNRRGQP